MQSTSLTQTSGLRVKNELYPRRHFPSFWVEIEKYLAGGIILHHWSVDEELKRKNDVTSHWMDDLVKKGAVTVIKRPKETPESYIKVCIEELPSGERSITAEKI